MPVKRRVEKGRRFSEHHREMLQYGPEAMLLAGVGYLEGSGVAQYHQLSGEQRKRAGEQMRADWERHGGQIIRDWEQADRTGAPWAEIEFGRPKG